MHGMAGISKGGIKWLETSNAQDHICLAGAAMIVAPTQASPLY
jgi:hypothetical protein